MYEPTKEWTGYDIRDIKPSEIPKADLWCFGFPCQDVSVSGKREGLTGERSGLFYEVVRLLKGQSPQNKPEWLLIENVKNLLSINDGGGFTEVLYQISEAGYDAEWSVFNSKDFGVPQNRERVYIIGHLREKGFKQILPQSTADNKTNKQNLNKPIQVVSGPQAFRVYDGNGLSVTLKAEGGGVGAKTGLYTIPCSEASITKDGKGVFIHNGKEYNIRRLTPKECFRLQGFSDEQFEKVQAVNSDSQLYRQAGNAVTVNIAYYLGKLLKKS